MEHGPLDRVDEEHAVTVTAGALEAPFTRLLSDLPGTRLRTGGQATWTLVVTRASWWTILPAVALFPLGVLFLLFREEADLVVTLRPTADGSVLRVIGTTRMSVADALRKQSESAGRSASAGDRRPGRLTPAH